LPITFPFEEIIIAVKGIAMDIQELNLSPREQRTLESMGFTTLERLALCYRDELGLRWTVAFDKEDFIGKDALLKIKREGLKTMLMGFEVLDPKVAASAHDCLIKENKVVGRVTRGAYGFAIKKSVGLGWVNIEQAKEGEELELEHENKRTKIKLARPLLKNCVS
jgi:glycine cleavage system aminomethyltransferase T